MAQQKTTNHYHYDELLTISVSPEGEIEWVGMIPKMQRTTNDGGFHSGYLPIVDGNSLHVMFNDHPRNAKRFAERKSRNTNNVRRSNLVMVSISPEAQMDYVVMHKNGKERLGPILRLSVASEHVQGDAVILSRTRCKNPNGLTDSNPMIDKLKRDLRALTQDELREQFKTLTQPPTELIKFTIGCGARKRIASMTCSIYQRP